MLVYIKPLSLFPEVHSDTLFGAICSAISKLYPDKIDEFIKDFDNNPPFIISSLFPYIDNKDKTKFLPKINFQYSNTKIENKKNIKQYKKIRFLEEHIFFKLLNNEINEKDILENFNKYYIINDLLMLNNQRDCRYNKTIIPHNKIDRFTNESLNIYYTEGYHFKNMGLYFIVKFYDKKYITIFKAAVKFLKDRGFGSDISSGKGQFDYEIEEKSELENQLNRLTGNYFITLSRYIPRKDELIYIDSSSTYNIGSKRGKSSFGEIRKQIRFFTEGSIFPYYKKEFYGQNIYSGEHKPAIEYGYAYPINIERIDKYE